MSSSAEPLLDDPPVDTETVRPPRRWLRRVGLVLGLLLLAVVVSVGALVGPYVEDDARLDRVVRVVALDWRDFGESRARERLQYELDHQGIGLQVRDEDCSLSVEAEGSAVRCAWGVLVRVPGVERTFPLAFTSEAVVTPDGALR